MKRNSKLLRASGILLVLTLITSCFVGGTFAKYVSKAEATDTARVAKWGVEVNVIGDGFSTTYQKDDVDASITGNTVISSTEDRVVAPGTEGTFGGIEITGTPEVAVEVETVADVVLEGWEDSGNSYYCPLVFTIGDETICGLSYDNAAGFETAIESAINTAASGEYAANTDLAGIAANIAYSWEWPFEGADHTCSNHVGSQTDEQDTALGDKAAEGDAPDINITVTTTVTQID